MVKAYMGRVGTQKKAREGQRRSKRLVLSVPLLIYGRSADSNPFREFTHTLSVNAHGALVAIAAKVKRGQIILVVHRVTREEKECRVVHVGPEFEGKRKVGVEFTRPAPFFWQIYFPPIDSKRSTN